MNIARVSGTLELKDIEASNLCRLLPFPETIKANLASSCSPGYHGTSRAAFTDDSL